ncbi:MAG: alpha/beta fold hydrolase [Gemmatimonadales bacterium]|nr:alpha/beta fold hydrolase [Gemmatimonadales bacterium]
MSRSRRPFTILALTVIVLLVVYRLADPERRTITDDVRRTAGGSFVRLSDGVTHYELTGSDTGRTVVLAAGSSVPYYIWDPTFDALRDAGYRVLRYDYYGRGFSDRPDVRYTQDLYVRQLAGLLDSLHVVRPIDLAGLSFGGSVITSFAARYPDAVRSLVYIAPGFRRTYSLPATARLPLVAEFTTMLQERAMPRAQTTDFLHPERFPDWADRYRGQLAFKGFRRARLSDWRENTNGDQAAEIAAVGAHSRPVLIIWGRQDPTVSFKGSAALIAAIPRAEFLPVDSSGHLPIWEQPALVQPAILAFLRDAAHPDSTSHLSRGATVP